MGLRVEILGRETGKQMPAEERACPLGCEERACPLGCVPSVVKNPTDGESRRCGVFVFRPRNGPVHLTSWSPHELRNGTVPSRAEKLSPKNCGAAEDVAERRRVALSPAQKKRGSRRGRSLTHASRRGLARRVCPRRTKRSGSTHLTESYMKELRGKWPAEEV